jgi:hypothetical protein
MRGRITRGESAEELSVGRDGGLAPAQGSTAPFAYRILYLCRLKDHSPRPRAEAAFRIDRFYPRIQRKTLGDSAPSPRP